jgi:hypothetical protein
MTDESQKALERILLMLPRTEERGASSNEADAAAKQIGRLVMKFPELLAGFYTQPQTRRKRQKPKTRSTKEVIFKHSGIRARTRNCVLICIRGNETWVPLAQILSLDDHYISMPEWAAEQNGFV